MRDADEPPHAILRRPRVRDFRAPSDDLQQPPSSASVAQESLGAHEAERLVRQRGCELRHVDGVGELVSRVDRGANLVLTYRPPAPLLRYVIVKGSIAIDGVSLTVNAVDEATFAVAIIPHTVGATHLGQRRPGARVNLEVDLIGKYVERLVAPYQEKP